MIYKKTADRSFNASFSDSQNQRSLITNFDSEQQNSPKDTPKRKRKIVKKENFKSETISILNQWMMNHLSYPYPNKSDCEELNALTGLTHKQIRVWCTNTRKRRLGVSRNDFNFSASHQQIMQREAENLIAKFSTPTQVKQQQEQPIDNKQENVQIQNTTSCIDPQNLYKNIIKIL